MFSINYLAVLVAAIVNMILGAVWYGPLFGKPWSKMMGFGQEKMKEMQAKGMGGSYVIMFIGSLLISWVLARFIVFTEASYQIWSSVIGLRIGFEAWLGFVAPVTVSMVLWEGKPWKRWMIVAGYSLVGFCLIGAILASWR